MCAPRPKAGVQVPQNDRRANVQQVACRCESSGRFYGEVSVRLCFFLRHEGPGVFGSRWSTDSTDSAVGALVRSAPQTHGHITRNWHCHVVRSPMTPRNKSRSHKKTRHGALAVRCTGPTAPFSLWDAAPTRRALLSRPPPPTAHGPGTTPRRRWVTSHLQCTALPWPAWPHAATPNPYPPPPPPTPFPRKPRRPLVLFRAAVLPFLVRPQSPADVPPIVRHQRPVPPCRSLLLLRLPGSGFPNTWEAVPNVRVGPPPPPPLHRLSHGGGWGSGGGEVIQHRPRGWRWRWGRGLGGSGGHSVGVLLGGGGGLRVGVAPGAPLCSANRPPDPHPPRSLSCLQRCSSGSRRTRRRGLTRARARSGSGPRAAPLLGLPPKADCCGARH